MACVNKNSPEFQELLKQTNNDVLLAEFIYNETYGDLNQDTLNEEFIDLKETIKRASNNLDFASQSDNWNYQNTDSSNVIDNYILDQLIKQDGVLEGTENQEKFNQVANAIGEKEAYRDYFENDKIVRPSKVILEKLEKRIANDTELTEDFLKLKSTNDFMTEEGQLKFVADNLNKFIQSNNESSAMKLAEALSKKLNIPYEVITEETMAEMFPNQPFRQNFYRGGVVYLAEGALNASSVFHEFAHPIIKSIGKSNPTLLNTLFNELVNTPVGEDIISNLGNDAYYKEGSLEYKEEAIVMALQAINQDKNVTEESKTKNFINQIFFQIKQWLRGKFGRKIDVSKLNSKTTLSQFVDMINYGKEFLLDNEFLDEDLFTMFQTDYTELKEQMKKGSRETTQRVMNQYYNLVQEQLSMFQANNDVFKLIEEDLADDNRRGLLQKIEAIMQGIATLGNRSPVLSLEKLQIEGDTRLEKDIRDFDKRVRGFVEALSMGLEIMDKFSEKLQVIQEAGIESMSENADALFAINLYNEEWLKQIDVYEKEFLGPSYGVQNGPLQMLLIDLKRKANINAIKSKNMSHDYVVDILYDTMAEQMKPIREDFLNQMEAHRKSGGLTMYNRLHTEFYGISVDEKYELNQLEKKKKEIKANNPKANLEIEEQARLSALQIKSYDAHNVSKEQLQAMLRGELSDAQVLSSLMETFMNSQDKISSTFAVFLQKTFQTIDGNANSRRSELYKDLKPLMKAAGFMDLTNRYLGEGKMGRQIGAKNILGIADPITGKIIEFDEWQFKSNFHNYDYDLKILQEKLGDAKAKWDFNSNTKNENAWIEADRELAKFMADFMHQDNLPIYYRTRNKYLSDNLGIEAKLAENEVLNRMRVMQDNVNPLADMSVEMEQLWQEYYQLSTVYDIYGEKKTGKALAIAERLTEYREAMQEFYEWEEREGVFEDELSKFILTIEADQGSQAWNESIKKWLLENTQISVKEEYYETRSEFIEDRANLTEKLDAFNKEFGGMDITPLYEELYAIIKNSRDDYNIYDGNKLTPEAQQKINDIHEKIVSVKQNWANKFGITKEELRDYRKIENKLLNNETVTSTEQEYYDNFWTMANYTNQVNFGIEKGELMAMDRLNKLIQDLSVSGMTPVYITLFTNLATSNPEIEEAFHNMVKATDIKGGELPLATELFDLARNTDKMTELFQLSSEFKEWFLRNHYTEMADEYDGVDGTFVGEYLRFRATAVWQYSQPKDLKYYNAKDATSIPKIDEGTNENFLNEFTQNGYIAINGIPRVPIRKFSDRKVKAEFQTQLIERDFVDDKGNLVLATQDNRGSWLPRDYVSGSENSALEPTYINADYKQMFVDQRAKWDLLDYLKNKHLDNQVGLDASQQMYISYPRYRRGRIEQFDRDYFKMKWLRFKDTFRVAADDFEDGLNVNKAKASNAGYRTLTRPIGGNYLLPSYDVSTNILSTMMDHAYSIEQYKGMRKVNSSANLLLNTLISSNANETIEANIFQKVKETARNTVTLTASQSKAMRINNVIAMIDSHLKGIKMKTIRVDKETGASAVGASNFNTAIMKLIGIGAKRMAFMSFAFDSVKALRNYGGAKLMIAKKSFEGRWYNGVDLALTQPQATLIMQEFIRKQYNNEVPSAVLQLLDVTGAVPSGLKKEIGGRWGRNIAMSLREGAFWYADRRYLNDSTVVHQFLAMLNHAKFELDGKKVSLINAVELRDGKVHTKEGVPADMAITYNEKGEIELGSKLRDISNAHQGYLQKSVGIASEYTEPEAYRWLLGKFTLFLLKFFPGMSVDKYQIRTRRGKIGNRRINMQTKQAEVGAYIGILKLIGELYAGTYNPKNLSWQARTSVVQLIVAYLMQKAVKAAYMGIMLGNDDDEDYEGVSYYDLLYQKDVNGDAMYSHNSFIDGLTAPMQSFMISPKYREEITPYGTGGSYTGGATFSWEQYFKLQAIALLQGIENEERTFNPWQAAVTVKDIGTLQSPMADGGILKEIYNIGNAARDLMSSDPERNKKAINKKESGPMIWQEEDRWKGWNSIGKILGVKGNIAYPQMQIKAQQRYFED